MASRFRTAVEKEKKRKPADEATASTDTQGDVQNVISPVQNNLRERRQAIQAVNPKMSRFKVSALSNQEVAKESVSAWDAVKEAVTGAKRTTQETIDTPEVLSGGLTIDTTGSATDLRDLKVAAGLLFSADEKAQKEIIKTHAPGTNFVTDDLGNTFGLYTGADGKEQKFLLNKPGFSLADAQRAVVDMAAFIPAAKFAMIGRGLLMKAGIAAAGAVATEKALSFGRGLAGSEETEGGSGTAAVLAALAELPGPLTGAAGRKAKPLIEKGLKKVGQTGLAKKIAKIGKVIDQNILESLDEAEQVSKNIDVDFLATQATGTKYDQSVQQVLEQQGGSSPIMMKFLDKQDEQLGDAVKATLLKIAPVSSLVEGGANFKKASKEAIKIWSDRRKAATDSVYKQIFDDPPDVDPTKVLEHIDLRMEKFKDSGQVWKKLKTAKNLIKGKTKTADLFVSPTQKVKVNTYSPESLDKLHNAKMELDDLIDGVGDKAVSPTAQRELLDVRDMLLKVMEDPSTGGSPAYGAVRKKFSRMSKPINKLRDSIIGRASKLKDVDVDKMSTMIFNNTNEQSIKVVKRLIDKADPEAFPMITRSFIEKKLKKIDLDITNLPKGQKAAFYKNSGQRDELMAVLTPEVRKNVEWLEKGLKIAARGRRVGSDTSLNQVVLKKLGGTALSPFLGIVAPGVVLGSVGAALSGARLLASSLNRSALDKNSKALAHLITGKRWSKDMASIRRIGIETPQGIRLFAQALNNAAADIDRFSVENKPTFGQDRQQQLGVGGVGAQTDFKAIENQSVAQ